MKGIYKEEGYLSALLASLWSLNPALCKSFSLQVCTSSFSTIWFFFFWAMVLQKSKLVLHSCCRWDARLELLTYKLLWSDHWAGLCEIPKSWGAAQVLGTELAVTAAVHETGEVLWPQARSAPSGVCFRQTRMNRVMCKCCFLAKLGTYSTDITPIRTCLNYSLFWTYRKSIWK